MQLTPEQLEKAARIAYEMWHDGYQSWGECPEVHKEDMRKAIAGAFAAVETPQVDVPVVLMPNGERVALEDPRVLGEPDDSETDDIVRVKLGFGPSGKVTPDFRYGAKLVLASRRARLLQPKTVEERVTIRRTSESQGPIKWHVCLDGETVEKWEKKETAEIYRLGLIAKLKAEGTTPRASGEEA